MDFFYARVSTVEQNLDRQLAIAKEKGFSDNCIFADKISGAKEDRPALNDLLSRLREGDSITVLSLDRLARSTLQLYKLADEFDRQGVSLISLKESVDTSTAQGKLFFGICAVFAEFERALIKERQAEGIAVAKEKGVKLGRKPTDKNKKDVAVTLYLNTDKSVNDICAQVGIGRSTFYNVLAERNILHRQ